MTRNQGLRDNSQDQRWPWTRGRRAGRHQFRPTASYATSNASWLDPQGSAHGRQRQSVQRPLPGIQNPAARQFGQDRNKDGQQLYERPSNTARTSGLSMASGTPVQEGSVCRICKVGRHIPARCIMVLPGTGMSNFCPICPHMDNHTLDNCDHLAEYLADENLLTTLHRRMGPRRVGLPPVYTKLICINKLTRYLGMSMKLLPWSVEHAKKIWQDERETLLDSLDYKSDATLPPSCLELGRENITTHQTRSPCRNGKTPRRSGSNTFALPANQIPAAPPANGTADTIKREEDDSGTSLSTANVEQNTAEGPKADDSMNMGQRETHTATVSSAQAELSHVGQAAVEDSAVRDSSQLNALQQVVTRL
ncbi:hypothetical protein PG997_005651 [Apiospora hydei]|uniref:Uncharacterized protein n=1 Tax=Apiospora hydei TaxID=1337664 RepID=A0ABR1WPH1_9PEZI